MGALKITDQIQLQTGEVEISYTRSSGPGGQNVNKVNSKAVLRWNVLTSSSIPPDVRHRFIVRFKSRLTKEGEILITGDRFRDRDRNVSDCFDKLREMLLAVAIPPKKRKKVKPTKAMKRKRLENKRADSKQKALRKKVW